MTDMFQLSALAPLLPELVLAVGALVLLMIGAIGGGPRRNGYDLSLVLIVLAIGRLIVVRADRTSDGRFGGSFVIDAICPLHEAADADRLGGGDLLSAHGSCARPAAASSSIPILILLATTGMMMMISSGDLIALYLGLELMSLSLYVLAAFDRDNARSTEAGLKYFVLGALSSGMLLYGASLIYGFTGTDQLTRGIAKAAAEGGLGPNLRPGVPARRSVLQGVGGAVPHVDARRVRGRADAGHGVLCLRAEGRRDGVVRARRYDGISQPSRCSGSRSSCSVDRLDGARRFCRDRPDQHQAADGLFLDRPHGLRAGRTCRRHRRGRAGRAGLYGDLSRDDARHLRLHPGDAARRQAC